MNKVNRIEVIMRISAAVVLYLALLASPHISMAEEESGSQLFQSSANGCLAPLDRSLRALHSNNEHDLCELSKGKVVMVVNTASQCGFTGQFADLEELHKTYQDQGLLILGFPSDSFRQEFADEEDTAEVCFRNFGVSFPMMATTSVRGDDANPLFAALRDATGQEPRWNFHKYVISADGKTISSFGSRVNPTASEIVDVIEAAIAAR
ncbi:MAG: glutathione peroxidase [Firmicutes bacterium]|nr:glutathione peroxidase [Gammaproteobacteria bacterium]MCL5050523.1 glutathione peroxidase [Bacillota bacterium]